MATAKKKIKFRESLFWDVDTKTIDPKKNAHYIIERILELGTDSEVRWLWNTYSHRLIYEIANTSRVINPQTKALWTTLTAQK